MRLPPALRAALAVAVIATLAWQPLRAAAAEPVPDAAPVAEAPAGDPPPVSPEVPAADGVPDPDAPVDAPAPEPPADDQPAPPAEEPESAPAVTTEAGALFVNNEATRSAAPNVDTQTGALSYDYPLDLPPGRGGMTPDLRLSYSSGDRDQASPFGYGWSIAIPRIERVNRYGTEKMYAASTTVYSSSLDGELVAVGTSTTDYVPRVEKGEFRRYQLVGSGWRVLQKDGSKLTFGTATTSQMHDAASSTRVFAWYLATEEDAHDNRIDYAYFHDANQLYPDTITYTSDASSTGIFSVAFTRESRPDPTFSLAAGFTATTSYRISRIEARVSGSWARRYDLSYAAGSNGARSLLSAITASGRDEAGTVTTLPATSLTYATQATSTRTWNATSTWSVPVDVVRDRTGHDQGNRFVDINGDGLPDILRSQYSDLYSGNPAPHTQVQQQVYLNTGAGWATSTAWTIPSPEGGRFGFTNGYDDSSFQEDVDTGARFADVDHDGYTDILWAYKADFTNVPSPGGSYAYDFRHVYLNNRVNGWATSTAWTLPSDVYFAIEGTQYGTQVIDVNGDRLPDIVTDEKTYLNTGAGWQQAATSTWVMPAKLGWDYGDSGTRLGDVNGDGLVDVLRSRATDRPSEQAAISNVYLNTGTGWATSTAWTIPAAQSFAKYFHNIGWVASQSPRLMDANGDGLTDIVFSQGTGNGAYLNTGMGWSTTPNAWTAPPNFRFAYVIGTERYADGGYAESDFNGDNMIDMVKGGPIDSFPTYPQERTAYANQATVPDLLTRIEYPEGARLNVGYLQSARYRTSGASDNPALSSNLDTVRTLTFDDRVTTPYARTYAYGGGSAYFASSTDTQFAGFASTTVTDARGNVTLTLIHQGNGTDSARGEYADSYVKIGKPYLVERYDDAGHLYDRVITSWDASSSTPRFAFPAREVRQAYDGNATHRDSAVERTYDAYGNLLTQQEWGEVSASSTGAFSDIAGDDRLRQNAYATSSSSTLYLAGFMASTSLRNASGTVVQATNFLYDGLAPGSVGKGDMTRREEWVSSSTYAATTRTYDARGLMTSEVNPRGATTTLAYDAYGLTVATTTNALSQVVTSTYDYASGQERTRADGNGIVFVRGYDGLGRLRYELLPDESGAAVTSTETAYADVSGASARTVLRYLDASTTVESRTYLDGFGRTIQVRDRAEPSNTYVVRDWRFGQDGLLDQESLPYFDTGSAKHSPTAKAALWISYDYDPLGRVLRRADAVGTTDTAYDQWGSVVTDALGRDRGYRNDAYGRLSGVSEHLDKAVFQTAYAWSAADALTGITDANGNVRSFAYDGMGRRTSATDLHAPGDGTYGIWSSALDAAGNVVTTTDPNGRVVVKAYDALNRPVSENDLSVAGTEIVYAYDSCAGGIGRLCVATSTGAVTRYAYDPRGRVVSETRVIDGVPYVTTSTFDRAGNVREMTYPDGSQVRYGYNPGGLLETVERRPAGGAYAYVVLNQDYAPTGQVALRILANRTYVSQVFDEDALYRLVRKSVISAVPDAPSMLMAPDAGVRYAIEAPADGGLLDEAIAPSEEILAAPEGIITSKALTTASPQIPSGLRTTPDRILGFTTQANIRTYAYRTDVALAGLPAGAETLRAARARGAQVTHELTSRRTAYSRTFATDKAGLYVLEAVSGKPQYYRDHDGSWWLAAYATTTAEEYDRAVISSSTAQGWVSVVPEPSDGLMSKLDASLSSQTYAMSSGTFYPDPSGGSSSLDGYCIKENATTWSGTRGASTAGACTTNETYLNVSSVLGTSFGSTRYGLSRGFLLFNTAALPDSSNVFGATLSVNTMSINHTLGSNNAMYVVTSSPASTTTLSTSDFQSIGSTVLGASDGSYSVGTYEDIALTTSSLSVVSKTGLTRLGLRTYYDLNNVTPTNASKVSVSFYAADESGTSKDPMLAVLYADYSSTAANLQVNYQDNPQEIVDRNPDFSAVYVASSSIATSTGYQVQVAVSPTDFTAPVWDSGEVSLTTPPVPGYRATSLTYAGPELNAGTTYYWRLRFIHGAGLYGSWSTSTASFSIAQATTTLMDDMYAYDAKGNVTSITDIRIPGAVVATHYEYDHLDRLIMVATSTATVDYGNGFVEVKPDATAGKDTFFGTVYQTGGAPTSTYMAVGGWGDSYYSYLQFDLGSVQRASRIQQAYLRLYNLNNNQANQVKVQRVTEAWDEGTVTSASNPAAVDAGIPWQDVPAGSMDIDITPLVKGWKDGTWDNYGMRLVASVNWTDASKAFATSDNASSTIWPSLRVTGAAQRIDWLPTLTFGKPTRAITYAYDALGSMTSNSALGSYAYAGTGYANPHAVTSIASTTYAYDANGNLLSRATTTYGWDWRNRLASLADGTTTTYAYDHLDARTRASSSLGVTIYPSRFYEKAGPTSTASIYAGSDLVATVQGSTSTASTTYVYADHLGSTRVVTDGINGSEMRRLAYGPYGAQAGDTAPGTATTRQYIGETYDASGLSYLNARYYEGGRGQFLSQDPVFWTPEASLADPQQMNSYSYARNNPINGKDPLGLYNIKTGEVEEGDTPDKIVGAINKAFGIKTDWDTVQKVSFYKDNYGDSPLSDIVGQSLSIGTDVTIDITSQLNELNQSRSKVAAALGEASLLFFRPNGRWDIKNSSDSILGGGSTNRKYWSYIYNGELIRYDAPGNINYGYVARAAGLRGSTIQYGARAQQFGDDYFSGRASPSFSDNSGDSRYIQQGINGYNSRQSWWQRLLNW